MPFTLLPVIVGVFKETIVYDISPQVKAPLVSFSLAKLSALSRTLIISGLDLSYR